MPTGGDVTEVLKAISAGDRSAMSALMPLVEEALHSKALQLMRRERRDHTLQATALVNEAYVKLVDQRRARWRDRVHFYAIAARVMRRILADYARRQGRHKRGGSWKKLSLDEVAGRVIDVNNVASGSDDDVDVAALDGALGKLEAINEDLARVVEMKFFGDMSKEQMAAVLGVSERTIERHWKAAQTWLLRELSRTTT